MKWRLTLIPPFWRRSLGARAENSRHETRSHERRVVAFARSDGGARNRASSDKNPGADSRLESGELCTGTNTRFGAAGFLFPSGAAGTANCVQLGGAGYRSQEHLPSRGRGTGARDSGEHRSRGRELADLAQGGSRRNMRDIWKRAAAPDRDSGASQLVAGAGFGTSRESKDERILALLYGGNSPGI